MRNIKWSLPALWIVGTLLAVVIAWSGVKGVLAEVSDAGQPLIDGQAIAAALRSSSPAPASESPAGESAAPATPSPSLSPDPPTSAPAGTPSTTAPARATAVPATAPPAATASPGGGATAMSRVFDLVGGSTSVGCSSTSIRLLWASPRNGFSVDVEPEGSSFLEVRFRSETHESKVEASCASGSLSASVRERER
jgi:hypothetical protein